ncbi:calcium calmodulin dependent kinase kinase 1 [Chlorella sorokiniana]|uniref:Calcium calmodulin dependent kinase kinase 1 n=1 Tax=Chlorella sorokiniana TaxID=3076 RepID=A0A2P6TI70_CHLSO|nr:calcium calmodulin dependent kinase kinase 1 [Chlorella sorokiniana]|eukprot:PRW33969.1 calcium calmodulin dependent kinase kinase 1 [Chlorella sorokiniana]
MGCAGSKAGAAAEGYSQAERRQRALGAESSKARPRPQPASNGTQSQRALSAGGCSSAVPSPVPPHHLSSAGSSDSDSDAGSDWDQFSWRLHNGRGAASVATSTGVLSPRDTVGSVTLSMGSATSQLRLRQDSLFGISLTPRLEPVKDSGRLRLCKLSGVTFVNQYMVVKYLGRGSSGRVFLCMNIDDRRLYAVKIVKKDQAASHKAARSGAAHQRCSRRDPLEDLRCEIAVMRRALHPNIVALREVVDDSTTNKMLLVMDYLEGGPVMTREGLERGHRVPEDVARLYFRDMCRALDYLHCRQRVVHGDLKPENALMGANGRIALSDFGCSKVMAGEGEEEGLFDRCNGTPAFLAPEMMKPHARYRGRPADVYALGGCLYSFVLGRIPFKADTVLELFEVVQSQPVTFPPDVPASDMLKNLLLRMLEKDPAQRLTLSQVMSHPWVTAGGSLGPLQPSGRQPGGSMAAKRELASAFNGASGTVGSLVADAAADAAAVVAMNGAAAVGPAAAGARQQPLAALQLQQQQGQQQGQQAQQPQPEVEEADAEQEALLRASLEGLVTGDLQVHTFAAGEPLMRRGQPGAHLLYILEGECEVVYRTAPAPEAPPTPAQPVSQALPIGSPAAAEVAQAQQQQQGEVVGEELPPTLLEAATRAQELLTSLRRGGPRDFLVAVRGPGDFVGETEVLGGSQSRRVASVVAASPSVRAAIIPYQTAKAYLARHPLAKQQLAQLMWLRQSEDLVLEALARLALLGEDLLRMLR